MVGSWHLSEPMQTQWYLSVAYKLESAAQVCFSVAYVSVPPELLIIPQPTHSKQAFLIDLQPLLFPSFQ